MAICDLCAEPLGPGAREISPADMRIIAGNGYGEHIPVWSGLPAPERRSKLLLLAMANDTAWAVCPDCFRRTRAFAGGDSLDLVREVGLQPLLDAFSRLPGPAVPAPTPEAVQDPPDGFVLRGHRERIMSVALSRDGRRALSAGWDQAVIVWDLASRAEICRFQGHHAFICSVAFLGQGDRAVSAGGGGGAVYVWDCRTGKLIFRLAKHSFTVHQLSASADGRWVLTASGDGTARLFDVEAGRQVRKLGGFFGGTHGDAVVSAALSADGTRALTGGLNGEVKYWDVNANRVVHTYRGFGHGVRQLGFLPGERQALVAGDRAPSLIDLRAGRITGTYPSPAKSWRAFALSGDGCFVAVGDSWDGAFVRVLDLATGTQRRQFAGHANDITSVAFSGDGRRVVSGSDDWTVRVWDLD